VAGALDPYTHPAESLQFHRALTERGVESVFVVYPTEAHGVRGYQPTVDLCTRLVSWFEGHMPAHQDR
jgi:dipeptidyl aminopeptidase/acylaminoacyl peptidase